MKKILIPALCVLALSACTSTQKYTINGTVEGETEGTVHLVKFQNRQADTLASAPIQDGKFKLEGSVQEVSDAYLTVDGKRGRTPLIIENTTFTATLNPADNSQSKVEGTANQKVINDYLVISNDLMKKQSELYKEYTVAMQNQDQEKANEIRNQFEAYEKEAEAQEADLIKNNADSFVSAFIIASKMGGMEFDQLKEMYGNLGENAKNSLYGKKIAERIAKLEAVAIGQTAPNFTLNTPEGNPLSLADIKGKVKIIDFWASWCNPCRQANPEVVEIYKEYHPKGLEILGVSLDNNQEAWVKAIEDDGLTWNHVSDLKGWENAAAQLYGVNSIPHLLVLDENNQIIARNLHGQELKDKIAEMLK